MTINDFRCRLVNQILFSTSQEDVKRHIDAAMEGLLQHRVNGHLVNRFVERSLRDFEALNPTDCGAQQWANIRIARTHLTQLLRSFQEGDEE